MKTYQLTSKNDPSKFIQVDSDTISFLLNAMGESTFSSNFKIIAEIDPNGFSPPTINVQNSVSEDLIPNKTDVLKKYVLTDIKHPSLHGLRRIRALVDIPRNRVKAGQYGGYVESERNLDQDGDCWIHFDCHVMGDIRVIGNSMVFRNLFYIEPE